MYSEHEAYYFTFNQQDLWRPNLSVLPSSGEFVWYSKRSGWGHLYLHDLAAGEVKNPVTHGEWVVRDLLRVASRTGSCTSPRRHGSRDGIRITGHLYRVALDGGEPELLTPEDTDHAFDRRSAPGFPAQSATASLSSSGRFFVDGYSTLSQPPVAVIRRSDGAFVMDVARADVTDLAASACRPPQPITTIAADGVTPLHDAMFLPRDLDPSASYAVVDMTYPGPQGLFAPTSFDGRLPCNEYLPFGHMLSEIGFVVVAFDGRGCSGCSRAYRYAHAGTEDVLGAADQVSGMQKLAECPESLVRGTQLYVPTS